MGCPGEFGPPTRGLVAVSVLTKVWPPITQVESILIKDIVIPPELQSSLSAAAQQRRLGEAKVLAASAEVDAARLMREAADILSSPAALQIRQLESLQVRPNARGFLPARRCGCRGTSLTCFLLHAFRLWRSRPTRKLCLYPYVLSFHLFGGGRRHLSARIAGRLTG